MALAAAACVSSGCAHWSRLDQQPPEPKGGLPPVQATSDAIPVELIFLRLTTEQARELEGLWPRISEAALAIDTRRRLDRNGVRVGIIDSAIPVPVQQWIERVEKRIKDNPLEQAGLAADLISHAQLLQCASGQRKEVAVRPSRVGPLVLMLHDGQSLKGRSYDDPAMYIDLRVHAKPDGLTMVSLQPEIQHGPMKQRYVGQDFAVRREMKRDADQWPEVRLEHAMQPGQMLVMTATTPPRGLGEHFFQAQTVQGTTEPLVLLLRVGQGHSASAFDPR